MGFSAFGKWLIVIGIICLILGIILLFIGRIPIPFGKLPGDIHVQKEKWSFHFPIVTCIVLSIFLTLLLNFLFWLFRK